MSPYSDGLGDQVVTLTVDELSERIGQGIVLWIVHGRGPEGITMEEIVQALRRQVPLRWLAVFLHDPDYAQEILAAADRVGFQPGTVIDDGGPDYDPNERFRFPSPD